MHLQNGRSGQDDCGPHQSLTNRSTKETYMSATTMTREIRSAKKTRNINSAGFATVNPSNGEEIETFSFYSDGQIEKTLASAEKSFQAYRKLSVYKRAQLLSQLAEALRKNQAKLAKVITTEMGKVSAEAEAEIEKCAREADWYAEHG